MRCSIYNLADCITAKILDLILSLINAPIKPLVNTVRLLLTQQPNYEIFNSLWALVVYILSAFYGLFILFAGLNFIISSASPEKRAMAKEWLQNVIMLIMCVQASYLIYTLIARIASSLTKGIVGMIDSSFFLFTLDTVSNFGLQITFGIVYIFVLIITIIVLSITYFLTSTGIIFFPFGIFFYFIPPLKYLGKFILSSIVSVLFLPFFIGLVLLAASKLVILPTFSNIKILLVISAFVLADTLLALLTILSIVKSVLGLIHSATNNFSILNNQLFTPRTPQPVERPPFLHGREYWSRPHKDYPRYGRYR